MADQLLAEFDKHASAAIEDLISRLYADRETIIAIARGRLLLGNYRYPDQPILKKTASELIADLIEELSDATVYDAIRIAMVLEKTDGHYYAKSVKPSNDAGY